MIVKVQLVCMADSMIVRYFMFHPSYSKVDSDGGKHGFEAYP